MLVGYIRVSTLDQNTGRQEEALKNYGVTKIFLEKVSGKNTNRAELKKMLDFVREGDVLVVESYSRLARSTMDLLLIVEKLKDKKVSFVSLKEQFDTSTPQGELMLTMFAGLAQFERTCMLQRQKEGIAIAKREGKFKGRKPIDVDEDLFQEMYTLWKKGLITAVQAQKKLSLKPNTFYRRVIAHEAKINK
jgi:DNA invertase Pin-like site-specific DNA recombinase